MTTDVDYKELQDLDETSMALHSKILEFTDSVAEEYIDNSKENQMQIAASKAVESYQRACAKAENVLTTCSDRTKVTKIQTVVEYVKQGNKADIEAYQHALDKFSRRKDQFEKCSPLTRSFLSPRSRSADDIWASEEVKVATYPEMNCMLVTVIIFALLATGALLCSFGIGVAETGTGAQPLSQVKQRLRTTRGTDFSVAFSKMRRAVKNGNRIPISVAVGETDSINEREL